MSDIEPPGLPAFVEPPRRSWRFTAIAVISALLHVLILGLLLLPSVAALPPPPEPINVDVVTNSELSSELASASSAEGSSASDSSSEGPSSAASSAAASSEASASSASTASSASSEAASSAAASSARPPSRASSTEAPQPAPRPGPRVTIPVGPSDVSSDAASSEESSASTPTSSAASAESSAETSSAASEAPPSALTAAGPGGADSLDGASSAAPDASSSASSAEAPPPPVGGGVLHAAKSFYLKEMLTAPGLANAKRTLKTLPAARRIAQTCNIEAYGQIGHAGYQPDAIIANAFAATALSGTTYSISGGAFRSAGSWSRIAYSCTLTKDMTAVTSFSFHIGADVTPEMEKRLSGGG